MTELLTPTGARVVTLMGAFLVLFAALRVSGAIDWSWCWVLAPLSVPGASFVLWVTWSYATGFIAGAWRAA